MKPLNIDKKSCSPISSDCVIWNGPDIECIQLCKGDNVTQVVYKLALELCKVMDKFNVSNYDILCLNLPCTPDSFEDLLNSLISVICEGGIQGPQGSEGRAGDAGPQGPQGDQGIQGPPGPEGQQGIQGVQGIPGVAGPAGVPGTQGEQGIAGNDGVDGDDGIHGRGVAVFVQDAEPTQGNFDTLYGTIDGFGVNGIVGANTFKPGDLWIGTCVE